MGILAWIVFGLIAGALAKFIMPGQQGGGIILTIVLGIVGAVVGGFIGTYVLGFGGISGFDLRSMAIAVGGALLVLFLYGLVVRNRG
ncbi:MAG: GlsB/YeaQ/YmgE family stress response membrane protein [candidate division GAL15 bacterium]